MLGIWLISSAAWAANATEQTRLLIDEVAQYGDEQAVDRSSPWWENLADAGLQAVITQGLEDNLEFQNAGYRVELAQMGVWQNAAGLMPTVQFEVAGQRAPTEGMGLSPYASSMPDYGAAFESLGELMAEVASFTGQDPEDVPDFSGGGGSDLPDTYTQGSALLKAALPIDIVGRQTVTTLAARKDASASRSSRNAVALQLSVNLGQAWYDLVAARQQEAIVRDQVTAATDMLEIVELRFERGEATALDVLQQRQQLASTETRLPTARVQRLAAHQRLSVSLGQSPSAELPASGPLPAPGPPPAVGKPSRLLDDRPDLQAAAAQLDAASMNRSASLLGLAPTFTLTGQAGKQFLTLDETESVDTWGVGAVATVPLFGGGRTHAGIRAARANRDIARNNLRNQVLTAVQQVETALEQESATSQALAASQRQAEAAQIAFEESKSRYVQGLAPYVSVLTAQVAHQAAQLGLLSAQRERLRARLNLYAALGGTWRVE